MRILSATLVATFLATPALIFTAAPVMAESMPNLIPAHDLSGSYTATGKEGPRTITVEYSKSANVLRITTQDGQGYLLYDFAAKDAKMVLPQMQRYMDQPSVASRAEALQGGTKGDDVSITTGATEAIAGHTCTDYNATDKTKGTSSTLCVTDDSVLLKLTSSDGDSVVAQSISYTPVPEADVTVPPGYQPFVMPQMPPGMTMPPGAGMPPGMQMPGQ
jgi:hypothetical protein